MAQVPIRFVGVGEMAADLELFHPERMASRMIGMGFRFVTIANDSGLMAKAAREEGFSEIADWFETLAKAEKSHAGRFSNLLRSIS